MRAFIAAVIAVIAIAFLSGGRLHPEALQSGTFNKIWTYQKQDAVIPALYDYIARYIPGISQTKSRKLPGPGPKLRPATPNTAVSSGTTGQAKPIYGGVVNQMYSKESMEKWKDDSIAQMQSGRNPFVEAMKKKENKS